MRDPSVADKIPLYVLEEHHEAFIAWHDAIEQGHLAKRNNALVHIDYHADMGVPVLRTPIATWGPSLQSIAPRAYDELTIGSFIIPAIFQGIFSKVYLMSPVANSLSQDMFYVRTYRREGKVFVTAPLRSGVQANPSQESVTERKEPRQEDRVVFAMETVTSECEPNGDGLLFGEDGRGVTLDIDLDYFSTNIHRSRVMRVEVTREEYDRFLTDRYHFLRMEDSCMAEELDGRYYFDFNPLAGQTVKTAARSSEEVIALRVEKLRWWLKTNKVVPSMITLCRSIRSGFTPSDQAHDIEQAVLQMLESLFGLQICHIEEVLLKAGLFMDSSTGPRRVTVQR